MTLRYRFILLAGIYLAGFVLIVGTSLYVVLRRDFVRQLKFNQTESARFLAGIGQKALEDKDLSSVNSYLKLLQNSKMLAYAMVTDAEGRVAAHTDPAFVGKRLADFAPSQAGEMKERDVTTGGGPVLELSIPLVAQGRFLGMAGAGYYKNAAGRLATETLQRVQGAVAPIMGLFLLAGVVGAVLMAVYLARPLAHLRNGARRIGEGRWDHRIQVLSRDELGELAVEFNAMAEKLQELDRIKRDFVSHVTHELRTPLTMLWGYVELFLAGKVGSLTAEQKEDLVVIKDNIRRLTKLIDSLLEVAKIEAKKLELHPQAMPLAVTAEEMLVLFRPQSQEKNVSIVNEINEEMPNVWADPEKITEIFTNLISNALKFVPEERGRIALTAREGNNEVVVTVKDNGIGIPQDSLERVFNKFEQVKRSGDERPEEKGTGLGLAIVKGYVEAHQGRVWIESRPGDGTSVFFTLPRA